MDKISKRLEEIVNKFMKRNVPEETKHDFIIAAIHFNINLNACSRYDLMRIDHKAKELANAEKNSILTKASIYSYILFRAINNKEIPEEYVLDVKSALMGISTSITDYLTYRIDESELNIKLYDEMRHLL